MRLKNTTTDSNIEMCRHVQLLGHSDYGVTELRTFAPRPLVAYVDNEDDIARLVPFPVSEFRRFHVFRPLSFESDDTISNSQG